MGCDVWMYGSQPNAQLQQECVDWIDSEPPGAPWPPINLPFTPPALIPFDCRLPPQVDGNGDTTAKLRSEYQNAFASYQSIHSAVFVRLDQLRLSRDFRLGFGRKHSTLVGGLYEQEGYPNPTDDERHFFITGGVFWRVGTGDPATYLFAHALRTRFIPNLYFAADYDVELFEELIHEFGVHEMIQSADIDSLDGVLEQSALTLRETYQKITDAAIRERQQCEETRRREAVQELRDSTPNSRDIRIDDLAMLLSLAAVAILKQSGITTLGQLASRTEQQVRSLPNVGETTFDGFAELLKEFDLDFDAES